MSERRVGRFQVGLLCTLALASLALLYAEPLLLAATLVPLAYVAYGTVSAVPRGAEVAVSRSFGDGRPHPGDEVTVTLTVENTGDAALPDLRVVDDVPAELAVVDGSPRAAVALRPGETATVEYAVVAKRGEFAFGDAAVRLRSLAGSRVHTALVTPDGDGTLSCVAPVSDPPVRNTTLLRAGTHPTDSGGSGLEFHSTRDYRPGDPMSRVHWRQFAKTNDLTTVTYREERAVRTVVVVDARGVGQVTPAPGRPTGTELCGYAAERLYRALGEADVRTSVAAVGLALAADGDGERRPRPTLGGQAGVVWADSDPDADAAVVPDTLFDSVAAVTDERPTRSVADPADPAGPAGATAADSDEDDGSRDAPDRPVGPPRAEADGGGDGEVGRLFARLPPTAQVVLVSPLLDDWPVAFARSLAERGYPLTLVSPDVTGDATAGQSVAAVRRSLRLRTVEGTGATTVSWAPDEPVDAALAESLTHLLSS